MLKPGWRRISTVTAWRPLIQALVRTRLAAHEYPRQIAFVAELPKTPAGKVHRKVLREREVAAASARPAAQPSDWQALSRWVRSRSRRRCA